jgi:hypothetical protein
MRVRIVSEAAFCTTDHRLEPCGRGLLAEVGIYEGLDLCAKGAGSGEKALHTHSSHSLEQDAERLVIEASRLDDPRHGPHPVEVLR